MPDNGNDASGPPASAYPGGNAPFNSGDNAPGYYSGYYASGNGGVGSSYVARPSGNQRASGGGTVPGAAAGTPGGAPAGPGSTVAAGNYTTSSVGSDVTIDPQGNVYGTTRNWDANANAGAGGYVYSYSQLGNWNTDPQAVANAAGIPMGMLQQTIMQQQQTISNMVNSGQINPYVQGNMTNQQLQQQLDSIRNANDYNTAVMMQQVVPGSGGMTLQGMQNSYNANQTQFNYNNMGLFNQSQLSSAQNTLSNNNYMNGQSVVGGLTNLQLNQQANSYGNQAQYQQGLNYNTDSGIGGMTYGQLGTANSNSQAQQQYNYNQNATAQSQYNQGMTNQGVSLASSNAGDAASLARNQNALGQSAYSNGQSRINYEQGITDKQDAYNQTQSDYNLQHQQNQNALSTYREGTQGMQAAKNTSRALTGLGWAGVARPQVSGWS